MRKILFYRQLQSFTFRGFLLLNLFLCTAFTQAEETIELKYSANPKSAYAAGKPVNFSLQVTNTAETPSSELTVGNVLKTLSITLANNNNPTVYNEKDVTGHPFLGWTVKVTHVGPTSHSALGEGTELPDSDLADTVTLGAGESVIYSIKAQTSPVAISDIPTRATVNSADGTVSLEKNLLTTAEEINLAPVAIKKPISNEYIPGDWVSYEITVKNTNPREFVNNFKLVDSMESCLKATMDDGSSGYPFEKWIVKVKSIKGEGTDPGDWKWGYGTEQHDDFENTLDIAPSGEIVYTLDALIKTNVIGTILADGTDCPEANVIEDGGGLDTPNGKPEVLKEVDKFYYDPGQPVTFTITIKNTGKGPLNNVPVVDDLAALAGKTLNNMPGKAFTSWTIKKKAIDGTGAPSAKSNPDVDGTVKDNESINTHVNIFPGDSIVYTIVAIVSDDLTTPITNRVTVGDNANSEITTRPKTSDLSMEKTVKEEHYSEDTPTITYTIVVRNDGTAGFATGVAVDDDIQLIEAELLHPEGSTGKVFQSWEITATTEGAGTDAGINPDYATAGLHARADIAPGGKVTYTIVGTLSERSQDHIVWGAFTNKATVDAPSGKISDSADTGPKVPDIRPKKIVDVPVYEVGKTVTYTIEIENAGDGYANDTRVTDDIAALGLFSSWTVTYDDTQGVGTRVIDGVSDNKNINTRVDIAPHSTLTFYVTGVVVGDISALDKVTNTVNTHDPVADRDASSSADVDKDPEKVSFNVTKVADAVYFKPGEILTYTIEVGNRQDTAADSLDLRDPMTTIVAKLANDTHGTHDDVDGSPFQEWRYEFDGGGFSAFGTDDVVISDFSLGPKQTKILTIECKVRDNVVSHKITNEVDVMRNEKLSDGSSAVVKVGHASVDNLRADSGGLVVKTVSPKYYKPGDEVVYTIKATSEVGYFNNVTIKDAISKLTVDTIDKGPQFPFAGGFTVSVEKEDSHAGGTTDGTLDPVCTVENNKDLDVIIDVGGGDSVTYTIKGIVIDDASGEIVDGNDIVKPYDPQYSYQKTTEETNYVPGRPLTYQLSIKNTGKKHLVDFPLKDMISTIQVVDIKGNPIKAFSSWTITADTQPIADDPATGAKAAFEAFYDAGTFSDNADIDTKIAIPIGGEIRYTISAIVAGSAYGSITNEMSVDGNTTSVITDPEVNNAIIDKTLIAAYKDDGTELPYRQYMPGGKIKFNVRITNVYGGNIAAIKVLDELSAIQIDWFNGSKGKALESWTVKVTTDGDPVTHADPVAANTDINQEISLGVDGWVNYEIDAVIMKEAVGDIVNGGSAGKSHSAAPPVKMAPAQFNLGKEAYSDPARTTVKTDYRPGDKVYYVVTLENSGFGTFYNKHVKDILTGITTDIAEDASTYGGTPQGSPFSSWHVSDTLTEGPVTNAGGFAEGDNIDIDTDFDLAPRGSVVFYIDAVIADNVMGEITNNVTGGGKSDEAILQPPESLVMLRKELVSIDGKPYGIGNNYYTPGAEVVYRVIVDNSTSEGWVNDSLLVDSISTMKVDTSGGSSQPAFTSWTVTSSVTGGKALTYVPNIAPNTDINMELDIGPHETVTFEIKAVVRDDATGIIPANVADLGGDKKEVDPIPPKDMAPAIEATFTVDEKYYIPGQLLTYHLRLQNTGKMIASDVTVRSSFKASQGHWILGGMRNSFDSFTISCTPDTLGSTCGTFNDDQDIDTLIDIEPQGFVEYLIKPTVNIDMMTVINVSSRYDFLSKRLPPGQPYKPVRMIGLAADPVPPVPATLNVTKTVEKPLYTQEDKTVVYNLEIVNTGKGNEEHIHVFDDISGIVSQSGKPVFRSWSFEATQEGVSISPQPPENRNLDMYWDFKNFSRNTLKIKVTAVLQGTLDEDITNTVKAISDGGDTVEDSATTHVTRRSTGEGDLVITKSAMQSQVEPGGLVEYELRIENPNDSAFENLHIIDQYPAGFRYVEGTGKISFKRPNEDFGPFQPLSPINQGQLDFTPVNLEAFDQCRIRYVLKASMALAFGSYKNLAYASNDERGRVSNEAGAMVELMGDKLFDTGSIIGKVFEDHNGNGFQNDATAKGIKVKVNIDSRQYVPQSTELIVGEKHQSLRDDNIPAPLKGITIDRLRGLSIRSGDQSGKAVIRYQTRTDKAAAVSVTSKTGSNIAFDAMGKVTRNHTGSLKKGLGSEQLEITRNHYRQGNGFRHEIVIENLGRNDEGIPGVRLITAEGFRIETDEHGRFHVPDRFILDRKGKNFVIKLDTDSLPTGMTVISENPKVQRITPNRLNKFNFSVQRTQQQIQQQAY